MNTIFFDCETTGFEEQDRICQFACITDTLNINFMCKPPVPISVDAMSVHHITEKMVENETPFIERYGYTMLKEAFESDNNVCIAHNAPFDMKMIAKEDITPKNVICTYKVIRYLDSEGTIPKYKLQYLRYFYNIDIQADAHDAMGDVLVLKSLFEILIDKMKEKNPSFNDTDCVKEMIEISKNPIKISKFTFGKYNGIKIEDIAKTDIGYLQWLHRAESQKPDKDLDMLYTLEQFI